MLSEQPGGSCDHESPREPQYFRTSLATSVDVDRNLFISLLGGKSRMPPTPRAPEIISLTVAHEVPTRTGCCTPWDVKKRKARRNDAPVECLAPGLRCNGEPRQDSVDGSGIDGDPICVHEEAWQAKANAPTRILTVAGVSAAAWRRGAIPGVV